MLKAIFVLNPNRDWKSRRSTLWHNLWLITETFVVSGLVTCVWGLCYYYKLPFHAHQADDILMISAAVLVCMAFFAFFATTLFTQTRDRTSKLSRAVLLGDEVEFMLLRDEKVQIMMHVVVGGFGFATIALLTIIGYHDPLVGAVIVWCVGACIVVYFIAMAEMQETGKMVWFKTHTPHEWLVQDTQKFFEAYRKKKSAPDHLSVAAD